jgi:predicted transposase YdaD
MCVQSVRRKGRQEGRKEGRKERKGKYIIITNNHSVVAQNRKRD